MSSDQRCRAAIDEVPALGKLVTLALQHVLTMYAGAITVPLLVASSLHLSSEDTAYLVSSDLFACGLVTLVQCIGFGPIGARLPVIMGVTFVGVMPSVAIASQPGLGLAGVYGATIAAGLIILPVVPLAGRLRSVLTPSVTGVAMLLIGLSLMGVAIDWAAGGVGAADYGSGRNLVIAAITIGTILVITRFGNRFMANCAILAGMAAGYLAAIPLGSVHAGDVHAAAAFRLVTPFHFGVPTFDPVAIASMVIVLLVTLVESSGMLTMLGDVVKVPLDARGLARGLRADAIGAIIGGLFNSFPYTSYVQNIALVSMTGVRSRFVCAAAAIVMLALAVLPKISVLVAAMPPSVLGGAALVLFGMVAATGIRSLATSGFDGSRENLMVIAISLGVGLIPTLSERFFASAPAAIAPFTHSGVLLGIVTAVVLNIFLRPKLDQADRQEEHTIPAHSAISAGPLAGDRRLA